MALLFREGFRFSENDFGFFKVGFKFSDFDFKFSGCLAVPYFETTAGILQHLQRRTNITTLDIKLLDDRLKAEMPRYATSGSAAIDLQACIPDSIGIAPGGVELIPTGLALDMQDPNLCAIVLPRSGLGTKQGLILGNGTGLIDSDYQGQVMVALWNRSSQVRYVYPLDRIAQMVFVPILRPTFCVVNEFTEKTERGEGGFGSTGV